MGRFIRFAQNLHVGQTFSQGRSNILSRQRMPSRGLLVALSQQNRARWRRGLCIFRKKERLCVMALIDVSAPISVIE